MMPPQQSPVTPQSTPIPAQVCGTHSPTHRLLFPHAVQEVPASIGQVPQSSMFPHPSDAAPHWSPSPAQVFGQQPVALHTPGLPVPHAPGPPQVSPAGQVPQSMTLPQPSPVWPQLAPSCAHVAGAQIEPPVPPLPGPAEPVEGAPPLPPAVEGAPPVELDEAVPPPPLVLEVEAVAALAVAEALSIATLPLHAPIAATAASDAPVKRWSKDERDMMRGMITGTVPPPRPSAGRKHEATHAAEASGVRRSRSICGSSGASRGRASIAASSARTAAS